MAIQEQQVASIQELTRRYARYSRSHSGLGAVWGGCCMTLFGVLTFLSYRHDHLLHLAGGGRLGFWRFLVKQPPTSRPLFMFIGLLVPALWLFGRAWIQRLVYERHGVVIPIPTEEEAGQLKLLRALEYTPILLIPLIWIRFFIFQTHDLQGVLVATGILLLLPMTCTRMASALDRSMACLIFVAGAALVSGGYAESTLVLIFAYSIAGLFEMSRGLKTHLQFRAVCKELDAVKKAEV